MVSVSRSSLLLLPLALVSSGAACREEADTPVSARLWDGSPHPAGYSPSERCRIVCGREVLAGCAQGPSSEDACRSQRCASDVVCAELEDLLACTVEFPRFVCDGAGEVRLAASFSGCQDLYVQYIPAAVACAGIGAGR